MAAAGGCVPGTIEGPEDPADPDDPFWVEGYEHDHVEAEDEVGVMFAPTSSMWTAATTGECTTSIVRGLAEQLVEEAECQNPGTMSRVDELPGVRLGSAAFPYLQVGAAGALGRAASGHALTLNSALRTVAQQYVLYTWYVRGRCTHVVSLAAPPGRSNHESGLAIDVAEYGSARGALTGRGFSWLGANDPVHYDYNAGSDLRARSVQAFQRLWNRNHPNEQLAEDGNYGPQTADALARTPTGGFATGPSCGTGVGGDVAIEVYWQREPDGRYLLRALADPSITAVEYRVDGYAIGGATRANGSNFPDDYTFTNDGIGRTFEVIGRDAAGTIKGRGVGLLDVTAGTGFYVKQLGRRLYEIGLERPEAGVASIEVRADGWLLTDGVSGSSRSARNAVQSMFSQLGARELEITTYDAAGQVRGRLRRNFTLR